MEKEDESSLAATPEEEENKKIVDGMEDLQGEEALVCNHFQLDTSFGPAFVEEQLLSEEVTMKAQTMIKDEKIVYTPSGPSTDSGA
ncbi:hypothetical protein SUGI_0771020 [Cryptomeria japonica]|nr:hypothetical protein SUGI_0771020 [Cryptomeria japonica]